MKISIRDYILSVGNLHSACHTSFSGKSAQQRRKREVMAVMDDVDAFVQSTMARIANGSYRVGRYRHFRLHDKKKVREISVLPYRDRCVQNLYKGAVEPIIINQATDEMCAGLPGRGINSSVPKWNVIKRVSTLMRSSKSVYVWQADVSKFYDNIRNVLVMKRFEQLISDKFVLSLLRDHLMNQRKLAIGDPWSHLIASLMMVPLVRMLKQHGFRLVNYADDILVFTETKARAYEAKRLAEEFAVTRLRLHFKPSQIRRVDAAPIRFCGYVYHPNGKVFIAKDTKKKYIRRRHRKRSLASYNGLLTCCNSRHLRKKVEMRDNLRSNPKIPTSYAKTDYSIRGQKDAC